MLVWKFRKISPPLSITFALEITTKSESMLSISSPDHDAPLSNYHCPPTLFNTQRREIKITTKNSSLAFFFCDNESANNICVRAIDTASISIQIDLVFLAITCRASLFVVKSWKCFNIEVANGQLSRFQHFVSFANKIIVKSPHFTLHWNTTSFF